MDDASPTLNNVKDYLVQLQRVKYSKLEVTKLKHIRRLLKCVTFVIHSYISNNIEENEVSQTIHNLQKLLNKYGEYNEDSKSK